MLMTYLLLHVICFKNLRALFGIWWRTLLWKRVWSAWKCGCKDNVRVKLIFTGKVSGVPILKRRKGQPFPGSLILPPYRPSEERGGAVRWETLRTSSRKRRRLFVIVFVITDHFNIDLTWVRTQWTSGTLHFANVNTLIFYSLKIPT